MARKAIPFSVMNGMCLNIECGYVLSKNVWLTSIFFVISKRFSTHATNLSL